MGEGTRPFPGPPITWSQHWLHSPVGIYSHQRPAQRSTTFTTRKYRVTASFNFRDRHSMHMMSCRGRYLFEKERTRENRINRLTVYFQQIIWMVLYSIYHSFGGMENGLAPSERALGMLRRGASIAGERSMRVLGWVWLQVISWVLDISTKYSQTSDTVFKYVPEQKRDAHFGQGVLYGPNHNCDLVRKASQQLSNTGHINPHMLIIKDKQFFKKVPSQCILLMKDYNIAIKQAGSSKSKHTRV